MTSIRRISSIFPSGYQLAIDLSRCTFANAIAAALDCGFTLPDLVYFEGKEELHLLLWQGKVVDVPADFEKRLKKLASVVPNDAIVFERFLMDSDRTKQIGLAAELMELRTQILNNADRLQEIYRKLIKDDPS